MKIALIQPNTPFLIKERVFPNIGLVRVGTRLKANGHFVNIFDFLGKGDEEIKGTIHEISHTYDLFGFSSTTPQFPYVMKIYDALKDSNPKARTVLGGPHASALYSLKQKGVEDINVYDLECFDTIFSGEGEDEGIERMFKKGWQNGGVVKDLDSVLIPDRDLLDIRSYVYNLNNEPTSSIQTQRGCPYQCTFCCGRDIDMYKKVRTHSPERVVKELDEMNKKFGFRSFMWYDDELNLNMDRLKELCGMLEKRNYQHRGFVRNDAIVRHPESVDWLKRAGFVKLCAGVESGSERILELVNKKSTPFINSLAREIIASRRMHYESFMLLGHPDETPVDVAESYRWLMENKPDDFDINLVTPYPGSKTYDDAVPSSKYPECDWEYNGLFFHKPRYSQDDSYYKGKNMESESTVRTSSITNEMYRQIRSYFDRTLRK